MCEDCNVNADDLNDVHSKEYFLFYDHLNAQGAKKFRGYYPDDLLKKIYSWEKTDIEKSIVENFRYDKDLIRFIPYLEMYDGNQILKDALSEDTDSRLCLVSAMCLYSYTGDRQYIDVISEHIRKCRSPLEYIVQLCRMCPDPNINLLLAEFYITSEDSVVRATAVNGLLCNKGVIKDINNRAEIISPYVMGISKKFHSDDINERKRIIDLFQKDEL